MEPINKTPFLMDAIVSLDKNGAERFIVALKATYRINAAGVLEIASEQFPIQQVDTFYNQALSTRLKQVP